MKSNATFYIGNRILKIIDNIQIDKEKCTLSFEYTQAEKRNEIQCTLRIIKDNNESSNLKITKQHNEIVLTSKKEKNNVLCTFNLSFIVCHQDTMTTIWHHIETIDFSKKQHKVHAENRLVENKQHQDVGSKLLIEDQEFIKTWQQEIFEIVDIRVKEIFEQAITQDFVQKVFEKITVSSAFVQAIKKIQNDIFNIAFYEKLIQQILSENKLIDIIDQIFEKKWTGLKEELITSVYSKFKQWYQNSIAQLIQSKDLSKLLIEIKADILKSFEINFTNDIIDRIHITKSTNYIQKSDIESIQQHLEVKIVESNEQIQKDLYQKMNEQEKIFEKIVQYTTKSAISEFYKEVQSVKSKFLNKMIQLNTKI